MAKNRTCLLCGQKYSYCPHCDRDKLKPTWYFVFCSDKCNQLDSILSNNTAGHTTLAKAKKEISKVKFDINDIAIPENRAHIEKIMDYTDGKQVPEVNTKDTTNDKICKK